LSAKKTSKPEPEKHPQSWHVSRENEQFGPYDHEHFMQLIRDGNVVADDLVWNDTMEDWLPLSKLGILKEETPIPVGLSPGQQPGFKALLPPVGKKGATGKKGGSKFSKFISMFAIITNPGILLKNHMQRYSWQWALGVSGLAFMLFFMQTSLDVNRAGYADGGYIAGMTFTGLLYGTAGVAFFALLAKILVRSSEKMHTTEWTVKAFGLGYAPALVYSVCGLLANIFFGWNTALTFGIPGVLWVTRPMTATLQEMTGGKKFISLIITLVFSFMIIFGWSLFV
jgi:hypothetical protein